MGAIAGLARAIETRRRPLPPHDTSLGLERAAVQQTAELIEDGRKNRDVTEERAFALLYGVTTASWRSEGAAHGAVG
jgi:hypothetical protein